MDREAREQQKYEAPLLERIQALEATLKTSGERREAAEKERERLEADNRRLRENFNILVDRQEKLAKACREFLTGAPREDERG